MIDKKEMDFEEFEVLLQTKSYAELTLPELQNVNQWVESEQEYEALRNSGQQMKSWFNSNPVTASERDVLEQLKGKLKIQHNQSSTVSWLNPFWRYAMTALVFGLLGWWIKQPQVSPISTPVVERVLMPDTVYVATKPDTVYLERVIYREIPLILTKGVTKTETPSNSRGISMKEKEELDKLLVSGSE